MSRMIAMDHIVLNVEDMNTILDFYTNVLGLEPERLDEFRQGKVGFPSVRINADTVIVPHWPRYISTSATCFTSSINMNSRTRCTNRPSKSAAKYSWTRWRNKQNTIGHTFTT